MVFHAIGDEAGEKGGQHLGPCVFVMAVFGVAGVVGAELGCEMADVVQQGGHDDIVTKPRLFRQRGPLQHVLGHGDGFAQIFLVPAAGENVAEERDDIVFGQGRKIGFHDAASIALSFDSSASLSA